MKVGWLPLEVYLWVLMLLVAGKAAPSDPSQPPEELRPLRTDLVELVLLLVDERPGGLPRPLEPRAEDAPRLVFAYWRVLVFPLFLRC